jgi:protein-disulfide isomerase
MKKEEKKPSGMPLAIIVGAFVLLIVAAWWFYNSSTPTARQNPGTANNNNRTQTPINAPAGANPPQMLGSPQALVTVEEFADFQCPTCATVHPMMKEIQSSYGQRIKFVFRNYPLAIPAHDKAYEAAAAAEAAGMQGKFWQMQDQLFSNQQKWSANENYRQLWADYAGKIGLDVERFKSDLASVAAKSRVDLDLQRGRGLNVNSTPSIFINGKLVPYQQLDTASIRMLIDNELAKASAPSVSGNSNAVGNEPTAPTAQ